MKKNKFKVGDWVKTGYGSFKGEQEVFFYGVVTRIEKKDRKTLVWWKQHGSDMEDFDYAEHLYLDDKSLNFQTIKDYLEID